MRDVYLWYTSPGRIQFFRLEPGIDRSRVFPEDRYRRYLSLVEDEQNYVKWWALSAILPLSPRGACSRLQACDSRMAER